MRPSIFVRTWKWHGMGKWSTYIEFTNVKQPFTSLNGQQFCYHDYHLNFSGLTEKVQIHHWDDWLGVWAKVRLTPNIKPKHGAVRAELYISQGPTYQAYLFKNTFKRLWFMDDDPTGKYKVVFKNPHLREAANNALKDVAIKEVSWFQDVH